LKLFAKSEQKEKCYFVQAAKTHRF